MRWRYNDACEEGQSLQQNKKSEKMMTNKDKLNIIYTLLLMK